MTRYCQYQHNQKPKQQQKTTTLQKNQQKLIYQRNFKVTQDRHDFFQTGKNKKTEKFLKAKKKEKLSTKPNLKKAKPRRKFTK